MKASKLLKKKTLVKKLMSLIFCLSSFNQFATAQEVRGGAQTAEAALIDRDYQCKNDYIADIREFSKACVDAGLPSNRESCIDKLNDCAEFKSLDDDEQEEEKNSSEFRHCQAFTGEHDRLEKKVERLETARDKAEEAVEKADEKIEKYTQDYHDTTEEINTLANERIQAKEDFDNAIAEINEQKASSLRTTEEQIETLQFEIEQTQDQITNLFIEQRALWTENKIACRQLANANAQAVTQRLYAQKASGQTYLSLYGMLAQQGRSARDEATIAHNTTMRNCTSIVNPENTKDTTDFGDRFLQKRAQDKEATRRLQREITRLEKRKAVAKKYYEDTLDSLAVRERNRIDAAIRQEQYLANRANQLRAKLTNIQTKLTQETYTKLAKQNEVLEAENKLQEAQAELTAARLNGSSDDKSDAFAIASSLAETIEEQKRINADCIDDERTDAYLDSEAATIPDPSATLTTSEGEDPNAPSPESANVDIENPQTNENGQSSCTTATPGVSRCSEE